MTNELTIEIITSNKSMEVIFKQNNDDIIIKAEKNNYYKDFIEKNNEILKSIFLEFKKYICYHTYIKGINVIDSNAYIEIYFNNVAIYQIGCNNDDYLIRYSDSKFTTNFKDCKYLGEESYIFKSSFVQIDKCPNWMQDELRKRRAKELEPFFVKCNNTGLKLIKKIFNAK